MRLPRGVWLVAQFPAPLRGAGHVPGAARQLGLVSMTATRSVLLFRAWRRAP